ncbi:Zinc finger MYM-type protein 1-like [Oopsacas minuta]|uniref:Zinc finger MYM-type protein 1-like n=1 Tax=Oopsacas minuta TaxID=111878 RepID=A0AAV7KEG8_9METZ|nr:Zinc finger MYM-type protein 1-like [Oopsacas minuta]
MQWADWKINEHFGTSVDHRLETGRRERINLDEQYLKTFAEVLLLCSRTEISLRGHDESIESNNRGNFLEILDVVADHDTLVKKRMEMGQKNAKYLSGIIQNEILNVMGNMVRDFICTDIRVAEFCYLIANESKDASKKEQLSICVRYVNANSILNERFLT